MPKTKEKKSITLATLANQFKSDGIESNGTDLICRGCGITLGMKKFQVEQHLKTNKHDRNKTAKLKQKTFLDSFEKKQPYAAELCKVSISSSIFHFIKILDRNITKEVNFICSGVCVSKHTFIQAHKS